MGRTKKSAKSKSTAPNKASLVKLVDNRIKSARNNPSIFEQKRNRVALTALSASTTLYVNNLTSGISQGTSDLSSRVGDQIRINNIRIDGDLLIGDTTNVVRVMLIFWHQPSSTDPAAGDIFDDSTSATTKLFGELDWDGRSSGSGSSKFTVLYDKRYFLSATRNYRGISIRKSWKQGKLVQYIGGSSTVMDNALYLCILSDSSAASHPTLNLYGTIRYSDV